MCLYWRFKSVHDMQGQVDVTTARMRALMDRAHNIRHVAVIASAFAGKTTLTDALVAHAGMNLVTGGDTTTAATMTCDSRSSSSCEDGDDHGASSIDTPISVSLHFTCEREAGAMVESEDSREPSAAAERIEKTNPSSLESSEYLINVIDCPGHMDLSADVTTSLRVSDGALVIVDDLETTGSGGGVGIQTKHLLRKALRERVKPVVMVNKLDLVLLELRMAPEDAYQALTRVLERANTLIGDYDYDCIEQVGDRRVSAHNGTVVFGCALHQWGFTLQTVARMYATKFGLREAQMLEKLWGDWFFDAETKQWVTTNNDAGTLKRGFCQFVIDPILKIYDAVVSGEAEADNLDAMLKAVGADLQVVGEYGELRGKDLAMRVLRQWLPLTDAILDMIVVHLPSPVDAQRYRADTLYSGPMDDECANSIRACDINGPLVMYVSRMVKGTSLAPHKGRRVYAYGRVFAGKISAGQKVRILGPKYEPVKKTAALWVKSIDRVMVVVGGVADDQLSDIPAGNTCALVGIDQYLAKTGTITTSETGHCIRAMKFSVAPVVQVTVEPKSATDLPKLVEAMKRLATCDSAVVCDTDYYVRPRIAATGEHHLNLCLEELQADLRSHSCELSISEPIGSYRETITTESSQTCLAKSPNKHNRIFCASVPLGETLTQEIESGKPDVAPQSNAKVRARYLAECHGWDVADARRIWSYGPDGNGPNLFVDQTRGVQFLYEIKDSALSGFDWATQEGVLCDEPVRGMRVNLLDVTMSGGAIKRGGGQIIPTVRRSVFACQLVSSPALMEPIYSVEIQCPRDSIESCRDVITRRRGRVVSEQQQHHLPDARMYFKAHLPVWESFGLTADLRQMTGGNAFAQCVFDHYQVIAGDPLDPTSTAGERVRQLRVLKGLRAEIPPLASYCDRL